MGAHRWLIDARDLQYKFNKIRYKACLRDIEKNYYAGFNARRENVMFKEELNDLEIVYKTALKNYAKEVEEILPALIHYMDKFLTVHKQNEAVREKLDNLLEKTGRESQEETDGGCDE